MAKKTGRPTKLTKKFIDVAHSVLFDDINAVILTDEELLMLINEQLEDEERVAERTFLDWKAGNTEDSKCESFRTLLKKALVKQKNDLFKQMREDDKTWTRWAWIIERKFDDWNIKQKVDHTTKGKELPAPILGGVTKENNNVN